MNHCGEEGCCGYKFEYYILLRKNRLKWNIFTLQEAFRHKIIKASRLYIWSRERETDFVLGIEKVDTKYIRLQHKIAYSITERWQNKISKLIEDIQTFQRKNT
jgi:hypothetical protein